MKFVAAILMVLGVMSSAQAAFLGRNALNQADHTCTVSGASKCVSFYNDVLDITILNNGNIGAGGWGADYPAPPSYTTPTPSIQKLAAAAGLSATGLTGWGLPTGDGTQQAGPLNQILSIWNQVGGSLAAAGTQIDGAGIGRVYWSSSYFSGNGPWWFYWFDGAYIYGYGRNQVTVANSIVPTLAVRPGDVCSENCSAPVPVPATLALLGLGLAGIGAARRKSATSPR